MQLIRGLHNLKSQVANGCVATIGNYDGVHLGHQKQLKILNIKARDKNIPSLVILFEPHPESFFGWTRNAIFLSSFREKILLLSKYGIQIVLLLKFNYQLAALDAESFVRDILVKKLNLRQLVVGDDFVFGNRRAGNIDLLYRLSKIYSFSLVQLDTFRIDGIRVSSSLIREMILKDDFAQIPRFLGRFYSILGRVIKGKGIAHNLGFPTANIYLGTKRKLSFGGVYLVKVRKLCEHEYLYGIANLGFKPTFNHVYSQKQLEVHILNFTGDLYGALLEIAFCQKLREEMKFASVKELKKQLEKDLLLVKLLSDPLKY